ncbi:PfaD family polyunsaturated fatty acid/polyketide biosynthesis protein [Actinopolyspora mortivallis]|uniref:PfaD family polyunsaturated fatty acid/polyketide biosynthesis protein n=1 Tax=Actinopolyspora mortivallis TaxID=33906 RepID=UPI00037EE3E0|nr:PfaD family polyunsaturated fatty acid/polyketide biosynthesis protein [Actinopolyspora mortivallis]
MTIADPTVSSVPRSDPAGINAVLGELDKPCYVVRTGEGTAVCNEPVVDDADIVAAVGPLPSERLGSPRFRADHGVRHAYLGGAMAGGIAREEFVIALARAGFLGSFGAAGLLPDRIERALRRFATEIPGLPYAVNVIHSPSEEALERRTVELLLHYGVRRVEASAFMDLTEHIVRYRLAGLSADRQGRPLVGNRVIAKVSRTEVAERFMRPPPAELVRRLLSEGLITRQQADLAAGVPMADDITVEADSGGHTDRRPLTALFPAVVGTRERVAAEFPPAAHLRIGAAGGIGTPWAAAAAFALGADYVVTGSVNQSCVEAGTSEAAKELLAKAGVADCEMAPAADMFELGVELQVLRKGTLFPMRAKRLFELYRSHSGIEELSAEDRDRLEKQILRKPVSEVWDEVTEYFERRDPEQLHRAARDPKRRMALVFRWYLGMASRWASVGEDTRTPDYQIWCGPAMGAFNDWVAGTYLAEPANRRVSDVAGHVMRGAALVSRANQLRLAGVHLPTTCSDYRPLRPVREERE